MASTRKPKRVRRISSELFSVVAAQLKSAIPRGSRLRVALSGGVDSVVLLDVLARVRARHRLVISAMHVNHNLQPHAGRWATFCRALCRAHAVPLRVVKVDVPRGNSVERAARDARYAVLLEQRADYVVLAHNQDDQAETLLLHLLRGSGVHGLAGMRGVTPASGVRAGPPRPGVAAPALFRPLLDVPRTMIERYARERRLEWVEDPTNADTRFLRNFLRCDIFPRIESRVPAYRQSFSRAARHAAEAAQLLDELAALDLGLDASGDALPWRRLREIPEPRARNVLRFFLARHGIRVPGAQRLNEALRQVLSARRDAKVSVDLGAAALRRFGDQIVLVPRGAAPGRDAVRTWSGESRLALEEIGGTLRMKRTQGRGISREKLAAGVVTVRLRRGGERLQPDARRPRRSVKNLLQELQLPPWERQHLPFLYCGEALVWVPGLGIDKRFQAQPEEAGWEPRWTRTAHPVTRPGADVVRIA